MRIPVRKEPFATIIVLATMLAVVSDCHALPAFARKYGMPCSACHEAWPVLNNFGQVFRDNGYQLGNERDAPVYQTPGYFPMTFRMTPQWHQDRTSRVAVDAVAGNVSSGLL